MQVSIRHRTQFGIINYRYVVYNLAKPHPLVKSYLTFYLINQNVACGQENGRFTQCMWKGDFASFYLTAYLTGKTSGKILCVDAAYGKHRPAMLQQRVEILSRRVRGRVNIPFVSYTCLLRAIVLPHSRYTICLAWLYIVTCFVD